MHAQFEIDTALTLATRRMNSQREVVAALVRGGNVVGEVFEPHTSLADVRAQVTRALKTDPLERLQREQRALVQIRGVYQRVHRLRLLGAVAVLLNEDEQEWLA